MKELPKKVTRAEFRELERRAKYILSRPQQHKPAAVTLAQEVLAIAVQMDNSWAEIFPVFELVDKKIREQGYILESGPWGYQLRHPNGHVASCGSTMREWLTNHAVKYGDQETQPYDPAWDD